MNAEKMGEFIVNELKLARTLLQLAVTNMADPTDSDGEVRIIDHADSALEMVRIFLPKVNMLRAEYAYYQNELSCLEEEVKAHPLAAKKRTAHTLRETQLRATARFREDARPGGSAN